MYKLLKEERETIITISEDEISWNISTNIQKDYNKFVKQNWNQVERINYEDGKLMEARFIVPRKAISFRNYSKKREVSEEQKEKLKNGRIKKAK